MSESYFQLIWMVRYCYYYYLCSICQFPKAHVPALSPVLNQLVLCVCVCVFTHSGPSMHLHTRSNSAENLIASLVACCSGPVVEITTIAPQLDCQPLMMKQQGETKAAPRAADVDAGSCLLCGGVCEEEVVRSGATMIVCGRVNTCTCTVSVCVRVLYICLCACVSVLWPCGYEEPSWEEEWVHSSWLSGAGGHTGTQRGDERLLCRCHPLGFSGPASKCHVWQLARCCSPTSCWQKRLLKDARVGCKHREHPNGSNIKESCWLLSVIEH